MARKQTTIYANEAGEFIGATESVATESVATESVATESVANVATDTTITEPSEDTLLALANTDPLPVSQLPGGIFTPTPTRAQAKKQAWLEHHANAGTLANELVNVRDKALREVGLDGLARMAIVKGANVEVFAQIKSIYNAPGMSDKWAKMNPAPKSAHKAELLSWYQVTASIHANEGVQKTFERRFANVLPYLKSLETPALK